MNEPESREEEGSNSVEPLRPYDPPKLKRLGTIHELTQTLPGASPTDNDPFTPGSTI